MEDRKYAVQEGFMTVGIQDRWEAGQVVSGTGVIPDRCDTGK